MNWLHLSYFENMKVSIYIDEYLFFRIKYFTSLFKLHAETLEISKNETE